jgi:hypothetical protein
MSERLGLDWSFDWELQDVLRTDHPLWSDDQIFNTVIDRRGSIMSYDAVPSAKLMACAIGDDPDNPEGWKPLSDVPDEQLLHVVPLSDDVFDPTDD